VKTEFEVEIKFKKYDLSCIRWINVYFWQIPHHFSI